MEISMQTPKVHLTKEKETMLITLYSRALHSRSKDPVLHDPWAEQAIDHVDYDFGSIKLSKIEPLAIAIRAKQFDTWVCEWIVDNPESTVLHLGCGLDSRVFRVDSPPTVRWFDVDYPEVIDLRRQLYPERPGYRMLGSSLLEPGWLEEVPGDLPAMILAEGVMMYLPADGAEMLLARLAGHFPSGRMAFDALSTRGARMAGADKAVSATGATFGWGLDDPNDVKKFAPKLELIAELSTPQFAGHERLPLALRAIARAMEPFPKLRRLNRLLLYRF
jgi:O-methyltransferase involved in polyketide biosynthesis